MGDYVLPDKTVTIEFDEYPGLAVELRIWPVAMTDYFAIDELVDGHGEAMKAGDVRALRASAEGLANRLSTYLVSWAFPEAPSVEALLAKPWELIYALGVQWRKEVTGVPVPLPRLSGSGGQSAEPLASKNPRSSRRRSSAKRS